MASFTFDPEERGSVIAMTGDVVDMDVEEISPPDRVLPDGRIVSDGAAGWQTAMSAALASIEAGTIQKVVIARQVDIEFDSEVPIEVVVDRLRASESDSYTFQVKGLVGASPELLVSLQDGRISSLALAGTASEAENLVSDKMDREHALHTTSLDVQQRTVLRFGDINHLATRFVGPATTGTTVMDVLGSLHPTAAVSGKPPDASTTMIRDVEPRSRGRYGGPVGWFNADGDGEFAIALRCGLFADRTVTLYAGGGIVAGSNVDFEFAETELKLRPMLKALGLQ